MTDYLVVVGDISARQCNPARLEMLRAGLRPRIVRIADRDFIVGQGCDMAAFLQNKTLVGTMQCTGPTVDVKIHVAFVRGLVVPEAVWTHVDNAFDCCPDDFVGLSTRFVVRANGNVEKL